MGGNFAPEYAHEMEPVSLFNTDKGPADKEGIIFLHIFQFW